MTGIDELDFHAGNDRHRAVVAHRLQLRERPRRVELGIQRQRGLVLRIAVPVRLARVFFLDVRGIGEDQRAQILASPACRRCVRENRCATSRGR